MTKLEQIVTSKDLSEELKAAGFEQDTINVWERSDSIPKSEYYLTQPELMRRYGLWGTQEVKERVAAPTTDELLAVLPKAIGKDLAANILTLHYNQFITTPWQVYYRDKGGSFGGKEKQSADTPVNALARLWLELKREGIV